MTTLRERLPWLGALVLVLVACAWGYHAVYAKPRDELIETIEQSRSNTAALRNTLKGEFDVRARAKALGATTLGTKLDTVEHRFRTGLARIGEQEGLTGVVVDDGQPQDHLNPVLTSKGVAQNLKQALRKKPDFETIRGTLKGVGTLEQVLRVLSVAQSQDWLHRVDGFVIKPVGAAREKFELRLDVATLFVPDLVTQDLDIQIVQPPAAAEGMWRAVVMKNVFKSPAPAGDTSRPVEVVQAAAPQAPTPPPQVFAPYDDWKLTGVVIGGRGPEAFFLNQRTGAKMTLEQGGRLLDAVFVSGEGEKAVLEIGGKQYEVFNGQTLASRRPV